MSQYDITRDQTIGILKFCNVGRLLPVSESEKKCNVSTHAGEYSTILYEIDWYIY